MSKTKTSGMSKNQAKAVVAVLLSAALLVGGGAVGYGMATDWTYQKATQIEQPDDQEQTTAGNAIITPDREASNGIKLMSATISPESYEEYGISTLAESAFSLTVTITPSNATYQSVDIVARWKNAQSEWASGKSVSDYLTINQTSDGSLTATGTVLKSFSEPIEITATLRGQEEITAKAQVDYVGFIMAYVNSVGALDEDIIVNIMDLHTGSGTLKPELTNCFVFTAIMDERVINEMAARGYDMSEQVVYTFTPDSVNSEYSLGSLEYVYLRAAELTWQSPEYEDFMSNLAIVMLNGQTASQLNGDDAFLYNLDCKRVYNGVTYDTRNLEESASLGLDDWSGFVVPADGMSFDNSQIVVG